MHPRFRAKWVAAVVAASAVIAVPLMLAQAASAAPVPPSSFTCGTPPFTPCDQTAHFSTPSGTPAPEFAPPSPQATGCPAWVATDFIEVQGTGNGIEHAMINNNLDGWFTSTFEGTVTVVAGTFDSTGTIFTPDPNVPAYTGHLHTWFGGSMNNKAFVNHDTVSFSGTAADGSTFSLHLVDHVSVSAAAAPAPNVFDIGSC
jgi:hypothetical protein